MFLPTTPIRIILSSCTEIFLMPVYQCVRDYTSRIEIDSCKSFVSKWVECRTHLPLISILSACVSSVLNIWMFLISFLSICELRANSSLDVHRCHAMAAIIYLCFTCLFLIDVLFIEDDSKLMHFYSKLIITWNVYIILYQTDIIPYMNVLSFYPISLPTL